MKRLTTLLLTAIVVTPLATAQIPVPVDEPLVNQYIADAFMQRSDAWWKALESQLLLMIDKPAGQVDENVLRNIIFFAHVHPDRMELSKASPSLLRVYVEREEMGFKILALSALHAVGDEKYVREAFRVARASNSDRILKMTRAALADMHRNER